jgi:hypothetical protein
MDNKIKKTPTKKANSLDFNREWVEGISPEAYEGIAKQARLEALREVQKRINRLGFIEFQSPNPEVPHPKALKLSDIESILYNLITQTDND